MSALWSKAHTLSHGLETNDGKRFRVVNPGRRNPRAGPDFLDATLHDEHGNAMTGDVELHLDLSGWKGHKHDRDPNYNGVVLHVVMTNAGKHPVRLQSGMSAPTVSLDAVADVLIETSQQEPASATPADAPTKDELAANLDRAGDERFTAASLGFEMEMGALSADQVVYAALMESLGYASNRKPFLKLAQRVPASMLSRIRHEPMSTRRDAIEGLLVHASGLLPKVTLAEKKRLFTRMAALLPHVTPIPAKDWKLFRVRPANHPLARISGAAVLIDRFLDSGFALALSELVRHGKPKLLIQELSAKPYIGDARAKDMAINVALPFTYAFAKCALDNQLRKSAIDLYKKFPKSQDNEIIREMKTQLGPHAGSIINSARRQQGAIHMYKARTRSGVFTSPPSG